MAGLIFRRVLWFIPVLFVISLVTFLLMHAAPGGPWDRDSDAKQVDKRTQALLENNTAWTSRWGSNICAT